MDTHQNFPVPLIIITGPTGVGKSDFALSLAQRISGEIINGDVGQLYAPLSIGTAKPDWRNEPVPHHLFDHLQEPVDYTVADYRRDILPIITAIRQRNNIPIIVGGSGFYLLSLLFPPTGAGNAPAPQFQERALGRAEGQFLGQCVQQTNQHLWQKLNAIDPQRAAALHPNDRYRIERALQLYATTGTIPSQAQPLLDPLVPDMLFIQITRDRAELYERINARTHAMLQAGWLEEAAALSESWRDFLRKKRLIGYSEIFDYLAAGGRDQHQLTAMLQQMTRHYAKRQLTFWRMLEKRVGELQSTHITTRVCDLTLSSVDLYLRQLESLRYKGPDL